MRAILPRHHAAAGEDRLPRGEHRESYRLPRPDAPAQARIRRAFRLRRLATDTARQRDCFPTRRGSNYAAIRSASNHRTTQRRATMKKLLIGTAMLMLIGTAALAQPPVE